MLFSSLEEKETWVLHLQVVLLQFWTEAVPLILPPSKSSSPSSAREARRQKCPITRRGVVHISTWLQSHRHLPAVEQSSLSALVLKASSEGWHWEGPWVLAGVSDLPNQSHTAWQGPHLCLKAGAAWHPSATSFYSAQLPHPEAGWQWTRPTQGKSQSQEHKPSHVTMTVRVVPFPDGLSPLADGRLGFTSCVCSECRGRNQLSFLSWERLAFKFLCSHVPLDLRLSRPLPQTAKLWY